MIIRREDGKELEKLKNSSHKKVWCVCDDCNNGYLVTYKYAIKSSNHRCPTCRAIEINSRKEVKEKNIEFQKNRWQNEDYKKKIGNKISNAQKEAWKTRDRKSKRILDFNYIKKCVEAEGYTVTTVKDEWENTRVSKIKYICPNGHEHEVTWGHWNKGDRCIYCSGRNKITYEKVSKFFNSLGYTLLSKDIINARTNLDYICPNGHHGSVTWDNFYNKDCRCPTCSLKGPSKPEGELIDFIKSLNIEINCNNRTMLHPKELDIVIPGKKVAIEFCGLYYHSEDSKGKGKKYHLEKLEQCLDLGYDLITIFGDEWEFKRDIVKNRILNKLGLIRERIYARNCVLKSISNIEAENFIEDYHIQGYVPCSVRLGLFYDDKLVSVMTFSTPSIAKGIKVKEHGIWELSRFCSSYNVVGGASKLLEFFKNNYEWKEIFTYADRRWSNGNLYKKLGFEFVKYTQPNYWYWKNSRRYHRFNFRKNILNEKLDIFDENLTEWENMAKNGYRRIWDCGNIKYIMKK